MTILDEFDFTLEDILVAQAGMMSTLAAVLEAQGVSSRAELAQALRPKSADCAAAKLMALIADAVDRADHPPLVVIPGGRSDEGA